MNLESVYTIIDLALQEDLQTGDYSSLACVPEGAQGKAHLLVKDQGLIAGIELAELIFKRYDPALKFEKFFSDGDQVEVGDIAFIVSGSSRSILATERVVLNFMQRMSGIATKTKNYVKLIEHTDTRLLDTRKTTPGIRLMEKWAVKIGGAYNHRFGLYDMIMLKDNHIDYAGGVSKAILQTNEYLKVNNLKIKVEIEVRNIKELEEVLAIGMVDRIMLDNFSPEELKKALLLIPDTYETEASGGITEDSIVSYAETGVGFISVGALTHNVKSLDLSLKAIF